jgi:Zn finger protein HypA/HybF involved in hydrogenase expression
MHETIIANQIIKDAEKHGKIVSAVIEVGELAGIPKRDLEKTLRGMAKWDFTMTEKESTVKCSCGYQGRPKVTERAHDFVAFECPKCKKIPKVVEGDEIILKEVTVE